ncbi:unspecific monooxygenase [Teladorsagia circumcincta]|uniref:Unspecific monooxygenase n=1 Tax=Teladorsagia circumcincta TaxID=45464 RepID=A0A2G9UV93_TELCI|nr:unspecific monooxygenase [Teladorsagia circumcincta]
MPRSSEGTSRANGLNPGPLPLPLIGNLHQIIVGNIRYGGIVELMKIWQKDYGNVITFWFGPIPTVHILDFETAQEEMIVNGAAYADRYTPYALDVKREGRGTIFSSGDFWADHRRFTLRTLRDFALKNSIMEERIMDEVQYNFAKLEESMVHGEAKINAGEFFDVLIGSVINRIIFSERFTKESTAEFFEVKHIVDKELMGMTAFGMSLEKWTLNIPILKYKWRKLIEPQEKLVQFLQKRLDQRKEDIASGKHSLDGDGDDFVDAFLIRMEKDRREGRHPTQAYTEDELLYDVFDLWIAGHETTAITVMWGFMHLIKNPSFIEKIRAELNVVTNGNRPVSLSDKEHTPYLNWTVLETQRLASIVNLNLWRRTKEGRKVGGYFVPEGTAIAAELSLIMSDEKYFKDSVKFDPGRYEEGGKELEQRVIPFGIGKRSCIGETLAKAEIYLILANMISRYEILEDPEAPIDLKTITPIGLMHRPKNFNIILKLLSY